MAICALPSLIIGFWLLTFPETPKYLEQAGNDTEWARTLEMMYKQNTGKSFGDYLVSHLIDLLH